MHSWFRLLPLALAAKLARAGGACPAAHAAWGPDLGNGQSKLIFYADLNVARGGWATPTK